MRLMTTGGVSLVLAMLAGANLPASDAQAQVSPQYNRPGSFREDPGAALSRNLRALAANPRSSSALTGAGFAALRLGDVQAALGFFVRGEEIAPRDGRIKAGIGASLVMMEQPQPALKFFDDARALGVPEAEFAGDRGLAYDLLGNPARAQKDYRLALSRSEDAEVRRRLALSLAIGGDRNGALALLEDQLRRQDRAAWRTRAFVLALTGDASGATNAARAAMPREAAAMAPFFARLPTLGPADRALAVHFGHFPGSGQMAQAPSASGPSFAQLDNPTIAGRPDSSQRPLGPAPASRPQPKPPQVSALPRPNPRPEEPRPSPPAQERVSEKPSLPVVAAPAPATSPTVSPEVDAEELVPSKTASDAPAETLPGSDASANSVKRFADVAALVAALPAATVEEDGALEPSTELSARSDPAPSTSDPNASNRNDAVEPEKPSPSKPADPVDKASSASKGAAKKAKDAAAKTAETKKAAAKKSAVVVPKEPSRIWVQVAGGADAKSLPREFTRLKTKAPKLFAGKSAWTTPLRATNRLLVGPFASEKQAREFVNLLSKADLSGFSWTSPAGQEIKKLPAR